MPAELLDLWVKNVTDGNEVQHDMRSRPPKRPPCVGISGKAVSSFEAAGIHAETPPQRQRSQR